MHFIDLHRQYDVIGDSVKQRIEKVLSEKLFIMGPEVLELEDELAEFTGRKYCLTCSSGTDALVIPLLAFELLKTDAVFVPSFTFFATAESVNIAGATPVFVDCDETYNIDPKKLEEAIIKTREQGKLTPRGIIPVDLFGLSADYDKIDIIAKKYDLFVLEDAAQGLGGEYKSRRNCSFGDVSATSFFPAKPLGCYGDGGAIFTDNEKLYEKMRSIRVHGQGLSRYDNVRIGMNGRLDTIQAAVLLSKLEVFKSELLAKNKIALKYTENLNGSFKVPQIPEDCFCAYAQYSLLAKNERQRNDIVEGMKQLNIPIMVYYEVPMHLQTAYKYLGYSKGDFPVCEDFSRRIFSLPMHAYLTDNEVEDICKTIKTF
ncbi:MAG: DegT/DnrJ/EryC1/StrS family aminotransferase [Oscillospiraceae bacterium]|jgi:dTDP-4-amino-4,6-dideoxygalactose transaminase|nr:DegT/DnrJ/EryC1/StrS family aminotransferase [Oscillospiraceae bacterium]